MSARTAYLSYLAAQGYTPNRAILWEEGSGTAGEHYTAAALTPSGTPGWETVSGYMSGQCDATTDYWDINEQSLNFLGTTKQTVLLIRAKRDTTLRQHRTFAMSSSGSAVAVHLPWNNGTMYWDFDNTSAPNRITWAGWTPTTAIETWGFRAGTLGSSIWYNASSVASQGTAITRSDTTNAFRINGGSGFDGDLQNFFFLALIPDEVSNAVMATFTVANVLNGMGSNLKRIATLSGLGGGIALTDPLG